VSCSPELQHVTSIEEFDLAKTLCAFATSNITSIAAFVVLLAVPLYLVARRVRTTIG
jgi:hypothetical protein